MSVILFDVNVFMYAHRDDAADHRRFRDWFESQMRAPEPFGVADIVLSGFIRIVTHNRIFGTPTPIATALRICREVMDQPNAVLLRPGERHWQIFEDLCIRANARADLVSDAYLAALAIEHGCELITLDRDFARFPGLRWRLPF